MPELSTGSQSDRKMHNVRNHARILRKSRFLRCNRVFWGWPHARRCRAFCSVLTAGRFDFDTSRDRGGFTPRVLSVACGKHLHMASVDRRYQVFISSTYMDLVDERREVIQALLEMDCLPAGMELFPAADDDQWTLIKQVIDESDYYVVIVGGRYGSTGPKGISYTEQEYDYAVAQEKPVLGFVHAHPEEIPSGKTQPNAQAELDAFLAKLKSRMVKTYSSPAELGSVVSRAMIRVIKQQPGEGWVRGQHALTPELQAEIAELRARVSELSLELEARSAQNLATENLASGDDEYLLGITLRYYTKETKSEPRVQQTASGSLPMSWNYILAALGPMLINEATELELARGFNELVTRRFQQLDFAPDDFGSMLQLKPDAQAFGDVLVQLFALNHITHGIKKRSATDKAKYWALTQLGQDTLMKLRAIPKTPAT